MSCNEVPIERLIAHVDCELDAAEAADVARHLESCAVCARETDLLVRSGNLIERLPRLEPSAGFAERVLAAAAAPAQQPRGALRRLWPAAAAAAAVLVAALAARVWWSGPQEDGAVLSASEEREIAADLYILANLEALEASDADELISLVEDLDLLEGTETEVSGLFGEIDEAAEEPADSDSEEGG